MTQKLETLTIHAGCEPDPTTNALHSKARLRRWKEALARSRWHQAMQPNCLSFIHSWKLDAKSSRPRNSMVDR